MQADFQLVNACVVGMVWLARLYEAIGKSSASLVLVHHLPRAVDVKSEQPSAEERPHIGCPSLGFQFTSSRNPEMALYGIMMLHNES